MSKEGEGIIGRITSALKEGVDFYADRQLENAPEEEKSRWEALKFFLNKIWREKPESQ